MVSTLAYPLTAVANVAWVQWVRPASLARRFRGKGDDPADLLGPEEMRGARTRGIREHSVNGCRSLIGRHWTAASAISSTQAVSRTTSPVPAVRMIRTRTTKPRGV